MPADALTQAAEQLAPAPPKTNFFDPAAGQNIIARYANTRRAGAGLEALGKATEDFATAQMRMEDQQLQRDSAARNRTIFDRETLDYEEKQNFKAQRGDFLAKIGALDPTKPDFQTVVGEVISGAPEVAMQDDAVQAILAAKNRAWETTQRDREREAYRKEMRDQASSAAEQRHAVRLASMGLKPDEFIYDPQTGELDVIESTALAVQKRGEAKGTTRKTDAEAEREIKTVVADTSAFPSQVENYMRTYGATDKGEPNKAKNPLEYRQAEAYDANKYESELNSAQNMSLEEYVNAVPGLKEVQKAKRRALWTAANGGAAPTTTPQAPAAAAPKVRRYNPATGKIE